MAAWCRTLLHSSSTASKLNRRKRRKRRRSTVGRHTSLPSFPSVVVFRSAACTEYWVLSTLYPVFLLPLRPAARFQSGATPCRSPDSPPRYLFHLLLYVCAALD